MYGSPSKAEYSSWTEDASNPNRLNSPNVKVPYLLSRDPSL